MEWHRQCSLRAAGAPVWYDSRLCGHGFQVGVGAFHQMGDSLVHPYFGEQFAIASNAILNVVQCLLFFRICKDSGLFKFGRTLCIQTLLLFKVIKSKK